MAPSSKIIALSLLAGASAAPLSLLGSGSGSVSANTAVSATADIQSFANAFINSATGGAVSTVATADAQLSGLVGTTKTLAFNTWAAGKCVAASHDITSCAEISAYLSAVYYAAQQGWTAAQLFAAMGESRVAKFQTLLQAICTDAPSQVSGTCSTILSTWPSYITAMAHVDAATISKAAAQLTSSGLLDLIDAAHISTSLMASIQASANAATGIDIGSLHLRRDLLSGVVSGLTSAPIVGGVVATATGAAAANANAAVNTAAGLSIGQNGIHAVTDIGTQLGANAVAGVTGAVTGATAGIPVVGSVVGQVGAAANAAVHAAGNANVASALNIVPGMTSLTGSINGGVAGNVLSGVTGLLHLRDFDIDAEIPTVGNGLDLDIASLSKEIAEGDVFANTHYHSRDLLSGLLSNPTGLVNGLPVSNVLNTVTHLPIVGNVVANAAGAASTVNSLGLTAGQNGIALGLNDVTQGATSLLGQGGISLKRSLLGSLPLLSSLPVGSVLATANSLPVVGGAVATAESALSSLTSDNVINSIPVVGNVAATAEGALSSVTNIGAGLGANGLTAGLGSVTNTAGSLLGGAGLHLKRDLLSGLPLLNSLPIGNLGNIVNTVNSLPVVGSVLNTVSHLPVAGNVVATAEGALSSVTNLGAGLGSNGLTAGLGSVTNLAGSLLGGAGLHLKREPSLLSGLPIVNGLPVVGGLLNTVGSTAGSLPVVGGLLNTVSSTAGSLPLVGNVVGSVAGVASSLPVVGNVAAQATGTLNSATNVAAALTPQGLNAGLGSVTNVAGSLLGGAGLHLKREPSLLSGLPIVNGLPVVGGLLNTVGSTAGSLPVVGGLLNTVGSTAGSVTGLASSLPIVGSVAAAAQGQASSINNLGLGLGQNGLTASLTDITGVAGGLLGSGALHI